MLSESHEKKAAWKQVWFLTQKNKAGRPLYYTGLKPEERDELLAFFYDALDYERSVEVGDRLGTPDHSLSERDDRPTSPELNATSIYNTADYSFGERKLWIPWAKDGISGAKRGQYPDSYPRGLVIHWTAGHRNGLKAGNELMRNTGMLYLVGDKEGRIGQSDSLKFHGYHAGKSSHRFANGYVSDEYAGLELQAAGTLTKRGDKYYSWFKTEIPPEQVVRCERRANIAPGNYHVYTPAQILATRRLVVWLFLNNPDVFSIDRVVGHDEVSPGRKTDPGGSIHQAGKSFTLAEFRKQCWNDADRVTEERKKAA